MAKTMGIEEAPADFPRIADEMMRTDAPTTVLMSDTPLVAIPSASHDAVDVAVDFMDEYASVFDKLAK